MKLLTSLLACTFLIPPALPQEGKVIVVNSTSKEAKRAAHRLHISLDQLKNARSALQEATDLARSMESVGPEQLSKLGESWVDLNRPLAADALIGLIGQMRKSAASATDLQQYQDCMDRAQLLISTLASVDADAALRVLREWPAPPSTLGDAGTKARSRLDDQSWSRIIQQLAYVDPQKAYTLAQGPGATSSAIYSVLAQQIGGMVRQGRQYDAQQLADRWIAEFKQYQAAPGAFQDYMVFLRQLALLDPNRFLAGVASGSPLISSVFSAGPAIAYAGDQGVPITRDEMMFLSMFRSRPQPELMLKAVDLLPGLKAKADQAGGVDKLMISRRSIIRPGVAAAAGAGPAPDSGASLTDVESLFFELRGKAEKNPGFVRQRLSDVAQDPQGTSTLIQLADRAVYEDPELGSMALEVAKGLLPAIKPLRKRALYLQRIVTDYRSCDGEVGSDLLRDGFVLVARMRDEARDSDGGESKRDEEADRLETFLLTELSRQDFDSSMRYIRTMKDKALKLNAILDIVQAIRQWTWG